VAEETGRILIVDDELPLLRVMTQYLSRLGYAVAACHSGREAWAAFSAEPSAYTMVLADMTMPEMSGQELLSRMIGRNPGLSMLICSGYPFDPASIPAAPDQIGFLQKPFTPKMLAEAVAKLLNRGEGTPAA
jgi:DNA-binding NtrC family response regulator